MKPSLNYFSYFKNLVIILALIVFSSVIGCSSANRCDSLQTYSKRTACQDHETVEVLTNLISFGFLGYIGYVLITKPAWLFRLIYFIKQNLDSNKQAKDSITQHLMSF
ncbi:hypothetical protein Cylst_3771 [Cylindrospermum stagnale PCC 7417]|uniref:Lipoprotein n=1 Tax=Cylindrospermum stagnale PCC 7417 TaxID=56107 RepID=K9WZU5_9NOST|nr:hypothetical protein Cylst_3771 [Cylindrospermum stagnale PCC 7417]